MVLSGKKNLKLVLSSNMVSPKKHTQPVTVFSFTPQNTLHTFPDRKDGLEETRRLPFCLEGLLFQSCCCQTSNSFNLQLMLFCFKYG